MSFVITGLDPNIFASLFGASDEELAARGARRLRADASPGYPDRITIA